MLEIKNIWYEFEEWSEEFDLNDCNSDVVFELNDGSKWGASFYTYQNLLSLSKKKVSRENVYQVSIFMQINLSLLLKWTKLQLCRR